MENAKLSAKSPVFIGLLLVGLGLVLFVLNFSVLPVIGVVLGVPAIGAGIYLMVKSSKKKPESQAPSK